MVTWVSGMPSNAPCQRHVYARRVGGCTSRNRAVDRHDSRAICVPHFQRVRAANTEIDFKPPRNPSRWTPPLLQRFRARPRVEDLLPRGGEAAREPERDLPGSGGNDGGHAPSFKYSSNASNRSCQNASCSASQRLASAKGRGVSWQYVIRPTLVLVISPDVSNTRRCLEIPGAEISNGSLSCPIEQLVLNAVRWPCVDDGREEH